MELSETLEIESIEEKKILEEKMFSIKQKENIFILKCSKTNHDTIILKIKQDSEFIYYYYEKEIKYNNLSKISKIFELSDNVNSSYKILVNNLIKFEKDLFFEFKQNNLIIHLKFIFPSDEIKLAKIELKRRENDLNEILNKLNIKFNLIEENQIKKEKKLMEKIDLIESKQNSMKNELDIAMKIIEEIKLSHSKLEDIINQNTNIINKIMDDKNNLINKFKELDIQIEKNIKNILKTEKEKELKNYSKENKENLLIFEKNQKDLKDIINKNNEKFSQMNKKILDCENSLKKGNEDIFLINKNIDNKIKKNQNDYLNKSQILNLKNTKNKKDIAQKRSFSPIIQYHFNNKIKNKKKDIFPALYNIENEDENDDNENLNKEYSFECINRQNLVTEIMDGDSEAKISVILKNVGKKTWPKEHCNLVFDYNSYFALNDIQLSPQKCNEI